jgi:hypothetical protein
MQAVDLMTHRHWVEKRLAEKGYAIPTEFYMTAPAYSPNSARHRGGLSPGAVVFSFSAYLCTTCDSAASVSDFIWTLSDLSYYEF